MGVNIEAKLRTTKGKGASRRMRNESLIPGIIYGIKKQPLSISLDFHKFNYILEYDSSVYTSAIDLNVDGKKESVILKDLQRNPRSGYITHADFLRIDDKHQITTMIPVNVLNADKNNALRLGAVLNEIINSIEIVCLPQDLPHGIDVDISELELDAHISLLDLDIPKGVVIKSLTHGNKEEHNQTVLSISEPKIIEIEEDEVVETEEAEGTEDSTEASDTEKDSEDKK